MAGTHRPLPDGPRRSCGGRRAPRKPWAAAIAALPSLDELKAQTARPTAPTACQEEPADPPAPQERTGPEDCDEEFLAWAEARFGVDPAHLAELLDAADDWTGLEDLAHDVVDDLSDKGSAA